MKYSQSVVTFLEDLKANRWDFKDANFSDISWFNYEGENALHVAVLGNDLDLVQELIDFGIEMHARGDLGYTPLHTAASQANLQMVKLLVLNGADAHALNDGNPPFTLARFSGKDDVCDYLAEVMKKKQMEDSKIWAKAKIEYLEREIIKLKERHGI